MCGLAGLLALGESRSEEALRRDVESMAACVAHRGPDDSGSWVDAPAGLALGHRRLAVVDLTETGAQPMLSGDGRFALAFNGEIYNHAELRQRLRSQGHVFRGSSDTESLLSATQAWGVRAALEATEGMFALALWDRCEQTLTLARDRMGEKPLYLGWAGSDLVFGSELRALQGHPHFRAELDQDAVDDLLRYSCIPAPRSIYRGVRKLLPGHLLVVGRGRRPDDLEGTPYWDLAEVAAHGLAHPVDEQDGIEMLDSLLVRSVQQQLLADVGVGCFLSGGIDSSLITAIAQEQSTKPLRTFTIGFDEPAWDEAPHARAVASHLGTDHVEHYVSGADALAAVPELSQVYDEPFADSSQLPTLLVSRLARRHVTVALSGDGGDELFAGYDRYHGHDRFAAVVDRVPLGGRRALRRALLAVPASQWDRVARHVVPVLPLRPVARVGERVHKAARLLGTTSSAHLYDALMSAWVDPGDVMLRAAAGSAAGRSSDALPEADSVRRLQFRDQTGYLSEDLLTKVDRAAMSVSLETRVPMLSASVVAHSWRLPTSTLVSDGVGKQPLRRLLARRVPQQLVDRPKQGFAVPLGSWLRGPLRTWTHDLLAPDALAHDGIFRPQVVQALLREHESGRVDHSPRLWPLLMFQAWQSEQQSGRT